MAAIYHFTAGSNLAGIAEAGCLRCHAEAAPVANVGNAEIKTHRKSVPVSCGPGGAVGDYVPFYFAPRSPMLFSIQCGNVEGVDPDQRKLVYLVSSTEACYDAGLNCVFTNGNAATYGITDFEDDPRLLATHVDFPLMRQRMWANTENDQDRRHRRMAEFLVHRSFPLELVDEIGVMDAVAARRVRELMPACSAAVRVRSGWYF